MQIRLPVFLLLTLFISTSLYGGLFEQMNSQNLASYAQYYKPIGEWGGQIILPPLAKRLDGGAVPMLVFSSPNKEMIGRFVRVAWNHESKDENWFGNLSVDVNFNPAAQAFGERAGCRFPTILDGWKKVSPLESLAANRSEGTIEVILKNPVYSDGTLYISEEPVQVNGSHVCLARFKGKAEGNLRTIVHFNPATRKFDGPEEIVTIMPRKPRPGEDAPNTSLEQIENAGLNSGGWFLYGKKLKKSFLVKALEPRIPLLLQPSACLDKATDIGEFVRKGVFAGLRPGLFRRTYCAEKQTAGISKDWPTGGRHLLIHLFGWRKTAQQKPGVMDVLNLVTGHFAFGFAEVIKDRFTGEPRWDIEYKQVYGHNREEVVSGSIKWHAYMGNLRRGWMYSIPVADTIIKIPELEPYTINGQTIRPMRGLARELEKMMAKYRVGSGSGCSMVRPDVSCVQDSHCALYSALDQLINGLGKRPEMIAWQKSDSADSQRFAALISLGKAVEKTITSFGNAQGNWKDFVNTPFGTRDPGKVKAIVNTLLGIRTLFPRAAHDHLLKISAERKYPMWTILTSQIGGVIPGLIPQKPTSLIMHK